MEKNFFKSESLIDSIYLNNLSIKLTVVFILPLLLFFSSSAFADQSVVPDWVKNNAKWWSEGEISEDEYLNSIQYLVENKIIDIQLVPDIFLPSQSNIPAPLDEDRAISYIVRLSGGELEKELVFSTFSKVQPDSDFDLIQPFQDQGFSDSFILESLPSKDKLEYYQIVSAYLNPGKQPELFDASIDVLTGDKTVLLSINYSKCKIVDYTPYSQDTIFFYQFGNELQDEIRDRTTIQCSGLDVEPLDAKKKKSSNSFQIPTKEDRVNSYVVHFFGPDFPGVYSINSFSKFFPSVSFIETPFVTFTQPGNPFEGAPQFSLNSLPSKDKTELYKFYSNYVNAGPRTFPFDVSIDLITGDDTILQRWNYSECQLADYGVFVDEMILTFQFKGSGGTEIQDKSDFRCIGVSLQIPDKNPLPPTPIKYEKSLSDEKLSTGKVKDVLNMTDYATSYTINVSGGELPKTYTSDSIQKFTPISRDRGPLTPLHHGKQYDFGFIIESLPNKERLEFYQFMSRYLNPGKSPEPFDFAINTMTGDKTILHQIKYTNCDAIDLYWYLQDSTYVYQFTGKPQGEIRERYFFYCEGIHIDFP